MDDLITTVDGDFARPFVVSGRRAYLVGQMDGAFPDVGRHLPGEMGGLWTPPLKLADGFWVGVWDAVTGAGGWCYGVATRQFRAGPGLASRLFTLDSTGLTVGVAQTLCVPDGVAGLLVEAALTNSGPRPLALTVRWLVRFDIQGAWWSDWPDRPDVAAYDPATGGVLAHDSGTPTWAAATGADRLPTTHALGPDLWGPEHTGALDGRSTPHGDLLRNPAELQGRGVSALLTYDLALAPGETARINFAIAGGVEGADAAQAGLADLLARPDAHRQAKQASVAARLAAAPTVHSPRPDLDRAFAAQVPCLDLITLDVAGLGTGIMGGLPHYAWFFGCDTYYSIGGLLVAGQAATALDGLRMLGRVAAQQGGRVPHEITPSGALFNPGNPVETGEWVIAVEHAYRWTGDKAFLAELYPVCCTGIFAYLLGECDPQGTLLPDGPGLLELRSAAHGKKLDVACSLYGALGSLGYLAGVMGDAPTAARCQQVAAAVHAQIERHFWLPTRGEYVWRIEPDLSVHPDEPGHSYAVLEFGLLGAEAPERWAALFATIEGPAHTGPLGAIHPGTLDFVMPIQNAIVALAEFRYGRPDQGLWYLERMAALAGHYTPWAIPEFVGDTACFIQAWSSAAYLWLLVQGCLRLQPDPAVGVVWVQPQLPTGWERLAVRNLTMWGERYDLEVLRSAAGVTLAVTGQAARSPFRVAATIGLPVDFV